jgi:hypothetical protein
MAERSSTRLFPFGGIGLFLLTGKMDGIVIYINRLDMRDGLGIGACPSDNILLKSDGCSPVPNPRRLEAGR